MNDNEKDRIEDACDVRDWEVDFHSDGCTIRTHNGSSVEYHRDADTRKIDIRAKGRMRTVIRVLRLLSGEED